MWIIFLIVIGFLIYFFVQNQKAKGFFDQSQNPKGPSAAQDESPLDILTRRFAKGEIEKEQYEKMKNDLEG
jgi:putative membrane protein